MTGARNLPESIWSELLGTVAVVDLESACDLYGVDQLPFPLGRSRPVGSVWLAIRTVRPIDERLNDGDLQGVRAWVQALVQPDVCVECRVRYSDEETPDLRIHGLRSGGSAFVTVQGSDRDGVDIADIYAVPPGLLGAVVAETVGLVGAGGHPRISITAAGQSSPDTSDESDLDFLMPPADVTVPCVGEGDIAVAGTLGVRSHSALANLQWVQIRGDGDYVFDSGDAENAEPVDVDTLTAYVDEMIADVTRW